MDQEILHVSPCFTDSEMKAKQGQFFNIGIGSGGSVSGSCVDDGWTIVKKGRYEVTRVFKADKSLLCCIAWSAVNQQLCDLGFDSYLTAGRDNISTNRGSAAGQVRRSVTTSGNYDRGTASNSTVIGYINSTNHKRPCRLTSFSRNHPELYNAGLPFIKEIDSCFKKYVPCAYRVQSEAASLTPFRITDTAFSTVTVNYNFRTALHKDAGDFIQGFGTLVVLRRSCQTDMLLFPQYKVAVELNNGDFMAMDVHEWHCNSEIHTSPAEVRLSFVCYLRDKLTKCITVNQVLLDITGGIDGKLWNTNRMFVEILGQNAVKELIGQGPPPTHIQWWQMTSTDERFCLQYKNKRYVLKDKIKNIKIHNLIQACEYARQERLTLTVDRSNQ